MLAPVVVFVYNRADHAQETLTALENNYLAQESDLYIFADNAKSEKGQAKVDEVRAYIDHYATVSKFKSVTITKAEKNKGLAKSIISGVTEIINRYGKVIVVEDDLTTSPDFLQYMNGALDFYEKNDRIWSISGYSAPLLHLDKYPHDVYMTYRGCSWGFATWKDRWDKIDWEVSDYEEFIHSPQRIKHFNRGGSDLSGMITMQMNKEIDSWAVRWVYQQDKEDMLTVYPKVSRILNNGCDSSGTHCGETHRYDTTLSSGAACRFENLEPDRKLIADFADLYDYSRRGKIKKFFKKLFYF